MEQCVGRFAPSPSGRMHLGNVYAALLSWLSVKQKGGAWLLRIEDLDSQRCKRDYAEVLKADLRWLGLNWDLGGSLSEVPADSFYQSQRSEIYAYYFEQLQQSGLIYPCYCRRADLLAANAPHASDHRVVYSGRCLHLSDAERAQLAQDRVPAMRLRVCDEVITFDDRHYGRQQGNLTEECGDFIVRRANGDFAYQLAVVVDDALMGVNEVVRGRDLVASTFQQIYLYRLLGWKEPRFYHLPLLMSPSGARLAKRDKGADLGDLRAEGRSAEQIIGWLAFQAGIIDRPEPVKPVDLVGLFDWNRLPKEDILLAP